jgi:DNA-binding transcriptional regulator LsrR (DeoR family)
MTEGRRARADQRAQRVNAAAELLASGVDVPGAVRALARRFRLSERQARRYVERALSEGMVAVPQPTVVFTVRLPEGVVARLRGYARSSGRTLSSLVAQAVGEFLDRMHAGPRGGRSGS